MAEGTGGPLIYCGRCGGASAAGTPFCSACGAPLPSWPAAPDPSGPPPPFGPPPGPPERPSAPDQPPSGGRGSPWRVAFLVLLVLVAAGAGAGGIVWATRTGEGSKAATDTAVGSQQGQQAYRDFPAMYSSLKGSIARIEILTCDDELGVGTGFAIDAHHILTVAHVVAPAEHLRVTVNGQHPPAKVSGLDIDRDVALITTKVALPPPYIALDTDDPSVGLPVATLGYPLGEDLTYTQGTVSAVDRSLDAGDVHNTGLVQTDTALNPGNSGGPLVGLDGEAHGVVDALDTGANGIGFALGPATIHDEVQRWLRDPEQHPLPLCRRTPVPAPAPSTTMAPQGPSGNGGGDTAAAASQLDALLQQSHQARNQVVEATQGVSNCTMSPQDGINEVQAAIDLRLQVADGLLSVDVSALPSGPDMITNLASALQSSVEADNDYIAWMNTVAAQGCPVPSSDPSFQAASNASQSATAAKQTFINEWDPIASRYGLTHYAEEDL